MTRAEHNGSSEVAQYHKQEVTTGSFAAGSGEVSPHYGRFQTFPRGHKFGSFYEGVQDAPGVQIIGGTQQEVGRALVAATFPDILRGARTVTADLSGLDVGQPLNQEVISHPTRIGSFNWEVSTSGLVSAHTKPATAARVLVSSMSLTPDQDASKINAATGEARRFFTVLGDDRPSLGRLQNALASILEAPRIEDLDHTGNDRNALTDDEERRIHALFGSDDVLATKRGLLIDLHDHVEDQIDKDSGESPYPVHMPRGSTVDDARYLHMTVSPDGSDLAARQLLLGEHVLAEMSGRDPKNRPDIYVLPWGDKLPAGKLRDIFRYGERQGTKVIATFGSVNDNARAVLGGRKAVASLGGLEGGDANRAEETLGSKVVKRETSRSREEGSPNADQVTETTAVEPKAPAHVLDNVQQGRVTLVRGEAVYENVPLEPIQLAYAYQQEVVAPPAPRPLGSSSTQLYEIEPLRTRSTSTPSPEPDLVVDRLARGGSAVVGRLRAIGGSRRQRSGDEGIE